MLEQSLCVFNVNQIEMLLLYMCWNNRVCLNVNQIEMLLLYIHVLEQSLCVFNMNLIEMLLLYMCWNKFQGTHVFADWQSHNRNMLATVYIPWEININFQAWFQSSIIIICNPQNQKNPADSIHY